MKTARHCMRARRASGLTLAFVAMALSALANRGALADPMKPLGGLRPPAGAAASPNPKQNPSAPPNAPPNASPNASRGAPPGMVLPGSLGATPASNAAGSALAGTEPDLPAPALPATPAEPRLLALREDSHGQWHALFDERWLGVGASVGDATIASIHPNGVRLRQGRPGRRGHDLRDVHLLPPLSPQDRPSLLSASPTAPKPPPAAASAASPASSKARRSGTPRP